MLERVRSSTAPSTTILPVMSQETILQSTTMLLAMVSAGDLLTTPSGKRAGGGKHKQKTKMSLVESFRFLSKSKYLGYLGLLVVSYGLSMEFTEIVWKVHYVNEVGKWGSWIGYASTPLGRSLIE